MALRRLALLFFMIVAAILPTVSTRAQDPGRTPDTPTPTATFTPSPTPTPAPTSIYAYSAVVPVGAVVSWASNYTPDGWLLADGSCISREDYWRLFEAIGETYDVCDGSTTFGLPDLRGRTIVGAGAGDGLTVRALGDFFGAETHQLTVNEMPSHAHSVGQGGAGAGTITVPIGPSRVNNAPYQSGFSGGNQAHNNMQPSYVLNYLIWSGLYPLELPPGEGGEVPTAAPEIYMYSTVEAGGVGQAVVFAYSVTAGDFIIGLLLFASIGLSVIGLFFRVRSTEQKPE